MAPTCSKCVSKKIVPRIRACDRTGKRFGNLDLQLPRQARDSEMRDTWRPEGAETAGRKVFEGQVIYSIAAA
jgi:hypothetical protein